MVTEVKAHQDTATQGSPQVQRYDVSIRAGKTIYVVLFTPANNSKTIEYAQGHEFVCLIKPKTIQCNDLLGRNVEAPIIQRKPVTTPDK
jgi:hypothetical protein